MVVYDGAVSAKAACDALGDDSLGVWLTVENWDEEAGLLEWAHISIAAAITLRDDLNAAIERNRAALKHES